MSVPRARAAKPEAPRETARRLLTTPFHERAAALCETNLWSDWKAYTVVDCYTTVEDEYFAIQPATRVFVA